MLTGRSILACMLVSVATFSQAQPLSRTQRPAAIAEPETTALRSRAKSLIEIGDTAAARLFLKRASDMGDSQAAAELAALPASSGVNPAQVSKAPVSAPAAKPVMSRKLPEATGALATQQASKPRPVSRAADTPPQKVMVPKEMKDVQVRVPAPATHPDR